MTILDPLTLAKKHAGASPAWLPDVFATLYDLLTSGGPALDVAGAREAIPPDFERKHFRRLLHLQDSALGDMTAELRKSLCDALDNLSVEDHDSSHWTTVLNVARLIDRVFRGLSHAHDDRKFLAGYRTNLGPNLLVRDPLVGGFVLPRAVDPLPSPKSLADLFLYLLRAPARPDCKIDYRLINRANSSASSTSLKVGFVPLIHSIEDLDWKISGDKYGVELPRSTEAQLTRDLPGILDWLLAREADFVLMPELVSSPKIVMTIAQWRAAHSDSRRPYLILAGSHLAPDPRMKGKMRNRAVVIGPNGASLWDQHKLHPYTFSVDHQRAGGWDKCVPAKDLEEDIQVSPWELKVRDIDGRRLVVAICEDFARESPHQPVIVQFGVTHVFVPIMNPQRDPNDWTFRYGVTLAQEPGTMSLVANSGTLVRRSPTIHEDYSMLVHPLRRGARLIDELRPKPDGPVLAMVREL